jgi:hypothetical protein
MRASKALKPDAFGRTGEAGLDNRANSLRDASDRKQLKTESNDSQSDPFIPVVVSSQQQINYRQTLIVDRFNLGFSN